MAVSTSIQGESSLDPAARASGEQPVLVFNRISPPAYRIPVLEKLNDKLGGRLVFCSGRPPGGAGFASLAPNRSPRFRQVGLPNYWLGGERLHFQPFREAFRRYGSPSVVVAEENPRSLSLPLLLRHAVRLGAGTVLWGHFSSNRRAFSPRNLQDRYRIRLARRADACLCYTEQIADLLRPHLPERRIFVARNTLDTDELFAIRDRLAREGKAAVRGRLGFESDLPVVCFIGRLTRAKGVGLLLTVFREFRSQRPARLVIIGDGPERAAMDATVRRERIADVHFLGPMSQFEESAPYVYASDVMLLPGYLGLAVNHAFCLGVPVVSQASPGAMRFHSPEVAYVRPGENGILSEYGEPDAMVRALHEVLSRQEEYSRNAHAFAREQLGVERMVGGMLDAINFAADRAAGRNRAS